MKCDHELIDLRGAFRPEPEACHAALMNAARSVKEEKEMKRASYRALLIAAAIVVSMMAVAFAAGGLTGWREFFDEWHGATGVPEGVYEQMAAGEACVWEVGPLTFTATELLTDGHIAVSAVHVRTTDGSPALITGANASDPVDHIRANGENGRALAARLGVDADATWLEAAAQLQQPLYRVSADHDMSHPLYQGDMMIDVLYNEDNSLTYFCMSMLDTGRVGETLTLPVCLDVWLADTVTGESTAHWSDYGQSVTLPVCPVLEERSYLPEQETLISGHRLLRVDAVRYVTGAYLTLTYEMNPAEVPQSVWALYDLTLGDGAESQLPGGMSMTSSMRFTIAQEEMIGVEKLPEVLTLPDGTRLIAE